MTSCSCFSVANAGAVWLQCFGVLCNLVGEKPTDLRMRILILTASFDGMFDMHTNTERKLVAQAPRRDGTNQRDLED
jgi:hypothetical protein